MLVSDVTLIQRTKDFFSFTPKVHSGPVDSTVWETVSQHLARTTHERRQYSDASCAAAA
jgi:hypothetical protein